MEDKAPLPFGAAAPITDNFYANDDWRFERPRWDHDRCVRCGNCWLSCPDGALIENADGYYDADLRYCKGCGLCARRCWTGCITMVVEAERPPWLTKE